MSLDCPWYALVLILTAEKVVCRRLRRESKTAREVKWL